MKKRYVSSRAICVMSADGTSGGGMGRIGRTDGAGKERILIDRTACRCTSSNEAGKPAESCRAVFNKESVPITDVLEGNIAISGCQYK